jgi:hypothetical protein
VSPRAQWWREEAHLEEGLADSEEIRGSSRGDPLGWGGVRVDVDVTPQSEEKDKVPVDVVGESRHGER